MARVRVDAGWVVVEVPGVDPLVPVAIAVGSAAPQAAFRDTVNGKPVARVPAPPPTDRPARVDVMVTIGGHVELAGRIQT